MCDLKVRRALLFRCMVAGLCWHFRNFSCLCKVFLQTFLHFASQFHNLKAISTLGSHFAAISKLGDHFTAKWHFRRPFRNPKMSVRGYKMALVCQKVVSQSRNTLRNGALAAKFGVFILRCHFAAAKHPAKWGFGCEIRSFYASQPFRICKTPYEIGLWLRNWEFFRSRFAAAK